MSNMATNRHQRRAQSKRKGLPQQHQSPNQQLHQRMAALEAQVSRQGEVLDANTHMIVDSLKMLEAMQAVQRRIMNDIVNGTARCIGDIPAETPTGQPVRAQAPSMIDYNSYLLEFDICQVFAGFAAWLSSLSSSEPLIQSATSHDVIEFGG